MLEAHVFVSPSHQDNSPNALCEATMLGMPCISTCAGGSSTIVKDGITGILVQDGDPWSMAGAIIEMANDRFMANKYAKEARKEAVVRHDKKTIVESLVEVYQVIASS
jgi:glycosyltransferase involved in cell wall biosynthesis